jgi:hypothetical protein
MALPTNFQLPAWHANLSQWNEMKSRKPRVNVSVRDSITLITGPSTSTEEKSYGPYATSMDLYWITYDTCYSTIPPTLKYHHWLKSTSPFSNVENHIEEGSPYTRAWGPLTYEIQIMSLGQEA